MTQLQQVNEILAILGSQHREAVEKAVRSPLPRLRLRMLQAKPAQIKEAATIVEASIRKIIWQKKNFEHAGLGLGIFKVDLERYQQEALAIATATLPPGSRRKTVVASPDDPKDLEQAKKREAVERAARLLRKCGRPLNVSRTSEWLKVAALLYGDRNVKLRHLLEKSPARQTARPEPTGQTQQ